MTNTLKKTIQDWASAQKGSLIMDLIRLVNIPSVSDPEQTDPPFGQECQNALAWMLNRGRELGFVPTNYDGFAGSLSLHGEEKNNPEQVTGIWCHLDVVPAGEGWLSPPFDALYRDGLVTGRGSQDNKSAAVMGLYVLKGLKELEIPLRHPAALYFGISEECGMQDLDYFLKHYPAPGLSLVADCGFPACFGQKGSLTVTFTTQKCPDIQVNALCAGTADNIIPGSASLSFVQNGIQHDLHAQGHAGHSAAPDGTQNAVALLLKEFLNLDELPQETAEALLPLYRLAAHTDGAPAKISARDSLYGDLTCCATILNWRDGAWELTFNLRYPHGISADRLISRLTDYAQKAGCTLTVKNHLASFGFSPDDPVIQKLTQVYNQETGANAKSYAMAGGTYAAKLPHAVPFGISFPDKSAVTRNFPKGHGDYHQPDESVEIDQIIRALAIYLTALTEIDETRY